jgi:hypothetical protein
LLLAIRLLAGATKNFARRVRNKPAQKVFRGAAPRTKVAFSKGVRGIIVLVPPV